MCQVSDVNLGDSYAQNGAPGESCPRKGDDAVRPPERGTATAATRKSDDSTRAARGLNSAVDQPDAARCSALHATKGAANPSDLGHTLADARPQESTRDIISIVSLPIDFGRDKDH